MLELMVSVCLISDPARCKDVALTYSAENLTPMQCMMGAQPEIAKWIEAHPKWALRKWTCHRAGLYAKI
ncbi:MAG: hypothetical protein WBY12_06725 [Hyphomicrobium sp.]|jgi:hypothetical protein